MKSILKFCCKSARIVGLMVLLATANAYAQKQKVWIDADTGNETDDIYAIARLLYDPSITVVGLSSAHFNNSDLVAFQKWNQYHTPGINTVKISQQLNEKLLNLSGRINIPHPLGADRQMGRAWGGHEARNSEAAQQLIKTVKMLPAGETLHVICLGALTNLASAIAIDTSITAKITCYLLGARYNSGKGVWDKNEFNIRNDLNAFDYLLNNPAVKLVVMPINTAMSYRFNRDSLYHALNKGGAVLRFLQQRWQETNPDDQERTLWDLALVEAYLLPKLCTLQNVATPPENDQHQIQVYTRIDAAEMKNDFFKVIEQIKAIGK